MSACMPECLQLFNHVTDAINELELATHRLKTAQQIAEELYISQPEER